MTASLKPLKWYRDLSDKKARLNAGAFLVEGEKAIRQVLANHPDAVAEILSEREPPSDLRQFPVRALNKSQFDYISNARTPQGLAAVVKIPEDVYSARLPAEAAERILLLEDIQDPGNAGTLIRTAAAFDFSGVILSDKCADPFSPKVVQASSGAVMSLWVRATAQYLELTSTLRSRDYRLIAAEVEGRDSPETLRQSRFILALGNEAAGLSADLLKIADFRVGIPIAREKAESLNAAISGGILMYLSSGKG
jgi:RNA methyltransferase, TrmH family